MKWANFIFYQTALTFLDVKQKDRRAIEFRLKNLPRFSVIMQSPHDSNERGHFCVRSGKFI